MERFKKEHEDHGMTDEPPSKVRISVITVCFNAAGVLARTIQSIEEQRCENFEWVVVDGGSTDESVAMLSGSQRPPDVLVSEPDSGIYDAMNKGIRRASGNVLYFLNADDAFYDSTVLADITTFFEERPEVDIVFTDLVVDGRGRDERHSQFYMNRYTLPYVDPCHQGSFARKQLFEDIGLFDTSRKTSADYEWFLRATRLGAMLAYVPKVCARFRADGAHKRDAKSLAEERRDIRLSYVSSAKLRVGSLLFRILHRVSRIGRKGLPFGHYEVNET